MTAILNLYVHIKIISYSVVHYMGHLVYVCAKNGFLASSMHVLRRPEKQWLTTITGKSWLYRLRTDILPYKPDCCDVVPPTRAYTCIKETLPQSFTIIYSKIHDLQLVCRTDHTGVRRGHDFGPWEPWVCSVWTTIHKKSSGSKTLAAERLLYWPWFAVG